MLRRVPLAWLQLTHEKRRLLAAVAGIAFVVVLMLMQLGFRAALFDSSALLQDRLRCDLVLLSRQYDYLVFPKYFARNRLYQTLGFEGVEAACPLYISLAQWKNPEDLRERSILAMGFDPTCPALIFPSDQEARRLEFPDVVFFDAGSRSEFGPVAKEVSEKGALAAEINARRIKVIGLFMMGISFGVNGNVLTSDLNFLRLFPAHPPDLIELGVVRLKPGADAEQVRKQMETALPPDVRVLTRDEFSQQERGYWAWHTGIGYVFTLGMLVGFVVGGVIVYQILYTDVADHLPEYATLKAVGYGHRYLLSVVLQEAFILSLFGFVPGLAMAQVLYGVTQRATLLPMIMTFSRAGFVLLLTVLMCAGSALIAVRKLRQADPAEIF